MVDKLGRELELGDFIVETNKKEHLNIGYITNITKAGNIKFYDIFYGIERTKMSHSSRHVLKLDDKTRDDALNTYGPEAVKGWNDFKFKNNL